MALLNARQVTADAAGAATITVNVPNAANVWDIGQISVETNPKSAACTATIRLEGNLISATSTGSGDTAIGPPNILLHPGSPLTVVWVNAPALATCTVSLLYDERPR